VGAEVQKIRPCVIVSPDEMNSVIQTIIVAPMMTKTRAYPTRVKCEFEGKQAFVVLDQIRTVDQSRAQKFLGQTDQETQEVLLEVLAEMFAP
jgi:mRNA interferase MazF